MNVTPGREGPAPASEDPAAPRIVRGNFPGARFVALGSPLLDTLYRTKCPASSSRQTVTSLADITQGWPRPEAVIRYETPNAVSDNAVREAVSTTKPRRHHRRIESSNIGFFNVRSARPSPQMHADGRWACHVWSDCCYADIVVNAAGCCGTDKRRSTLGALKTPLRCRVVTSTIAPWRGHRPTRETRSVWRTLRSITKYAQATGRRRARAVTDSAAPSHACHDVVRIPFHASAPPRLARRQRCVCTGRFLRRRDVALRGDAPLGVAIGQSAMTAAFLQRRGK